MLQRFAGLAAAVAVATMAQTASAAAGQCVSLTDPAGDQRFLPVGTPTYDATDLLGADVVASGDDVTVVFRLAGPPAPLPGTTYAYGVRFEDANAYYSLGAYLEGVPAPSNPLWSTYSLGVESKSPDPDPAPVHVSHIHTTDVTGSVDLSANEIRVTAPASAFADGLPQGRTWTVQSVQTARGSVPGTYGPFDSIDGQGAPLAVGDGTCA